MSDVLWEDDVLVKSALQGDQTAFAQIVEKYRDKVHSVCYVHVLNHEESLDLVQDVFIRAYEKLDTLKNWSKLGPFLSVIARNLSVDRLRIQKRFNSATEQMERANVDEHLMQQGLSEAERNDLHAVLRVLIRTLPPSSREVVLLHYFQEMTTAEIAAFLNVRQAAVLQRLHYGRKLLRTHMERELRPALEDNQQRTKHIQGIIAAIPFGSAPWFGQPLPVQPKPWPLARPASLFKSGAVGVGLTAITGLVVLWFVLMYPQQPNPSERITPQAPPVSVARTLSPAPDVPPPTAQAAPPADRLTEPATQAEKAAVTASASAEPIHLVLGSPPWSPPGQSRDALNALIAEYAAVEPGVTISLAPNRNAPATDTVRLEDVGDIILDESVQCGGNSIIARLRLVHGVVPLDEFMAETDIDFADYYPNLQELVTADGQVWGVPFLVDSWAFAFPSNLEDEPWIAENLRRWDDFPDLLGAMWIDNARDSGSISAVTLDAGILWTCLFLNAGGDLNNITMLALDSAPTKNAFSQFWKWYERNPPAFRPAESTPDASFDDALVMVTGLSEDQRSLGSVLREFPEAQVLAAPGPGAIAPVYTHVLAITRSNPAKERAAWDFVRWLSSADVMTQLFEQQGMLPLRASLSRLVTSPEQMVMLKQLQRMRFQKPDSACIDAYTQIQLTLDRELSARYDAFTAGAVTAEFAEVSGAGTLTISGSTDEQP